MNSLEEAIKQVIMDAVVEIEEIIKIEHPKILAKLAEEIFDSAGTTHGRQWKANKPKTVKNKGFNKRNFETGDLRNILATPGFLENDDYMDALPSSRNGKGSYKYANDIDGHSNRFDDIGRTDQDKEYINDQLAQKIEQIFSKK